MWKSFRWKECTFCQRIYMCLFQRFTNLLSFFVFGITCLLIICHYLFLLRKYRLIAKHQSHTVSKLGNRDFQSYNNRNSDLNIARHLHQVHLKRQQEYSIPGRGYRIAKISACVNVFITIKMFSRSVWLLSLSLSVFKHILWLRMAVYLSLHRVYLHEYGSYQKRKFDV